MSKHRVTKGVSKHRVTKAIPIYVLSWREYAKGESGTYGVIRSQSHSVRIEREAALSLFGALEAAGNFYDVELRRAEGFLYTLGPEVKQAAPKQDGEESKAARGTGA